MTTLAWIDQQTKICTNVSYDIRPVSEIVIPGYQILDLDQTPTAGWDWDDATKEWVFVDRNNGEGGIGDIYENGKLVQPKPDYIPVPQQPATSGTQEL